MKRIAVVVVGLTTMVLLGGCGNSAQENGTQAVEQKIAEGPRTRDEVCQDIADVELNLHDRIFDENPALKTMKEDEMTKEQLAFTDGLTREWGESLATIERDAPDELAVELRNVAPLISATGSGEGSDLSDLSVSMLQDGLDSMRRINSMCGAEELFDGDPET